MPAMPVWRWAGTTAITRSRSKTTGGASPRRIRPRKGSGRATRPITASASCANGPAASEAISRSRRAPAEGRACGCAFRWRSSGTGRPNEHRKRGGPMSEELRVVLIDDHVLCQRGLTDVLHHRGGIKVVGATGNGNEASRLIAELAPDIVIMDLRMPQVDGIVLL